MADTDRIAGAAREVGGRVQGAVRHAADEAYDYAEDAYAEGRRALREGHDQAAEWPHASLIVAGLVGFGLGLLVSRL